MLMKYRNEIVDFSKIVNASVCLAFGRVAICFEGINTKNCYFNFENRTDAVYVLEMIFYYSKKGDTHLDIDDLLNKRKHRQELAQEYK
jgi:hypothetical protein